MNIQHRPTMPATWTAGEERVSEIGAAALPGARVIASGILFNGNSEVIIEHGGSHYRLKITRQNKLILNK